MTNSLSEPGVNLEHYRFGEPIKLAGLQLDGVAAESARAGEEIRLYTRLSLTSDDRFFHKVAEGLCDHIEYVARQSGYVIDPKRAPQVLLVVHANNTGELWLGSAPMTLHIITKRAVVAGSVCFESDIADVIGMSPEVPIAPEDRLVFLFREGWRFGLFLDLNPDRDYSLTAMQHDLGILYRRLRYRDLYDAITDQAIFSRLVGAGWFPFVEILGPLFQRLVNACEAGFDLKDEEEAILRTFNSERLELMLKRWLTKPHFSNKEPVLRAAQRAFASGEAISVVKIALTEIEGILNDAYRSVHGRGAKINALLDYAVASAEAKAGGPDTLLLTGAFADFLKTHTFANFDPSAGPGHAGSRHAVGHGVASAESYTMVRALQALLTLDQLAFYT